MLRRRTILLTALLTPQAARAAGPDLWDTLRAGAVALFRHANAPGTGDPPGFRLNDCATQRNLGDTGRNQAVAIGTRFRAERVTVTQVLTSQWCRAIDTAEIAFPGLPRPDPVFNSFFDDRTPEPAQTAAAKARIAGWTGPGTLVIITHQVNITALTGIVPSEAEGLVLQPAPSGFVLRGRLPFPAGKGQN